MQERSMKHKRQRGTMAKARPQTSLLARLHPDAAGIDCGAAEHFVAVPPDRDPTPVRSFSTFTGSLERLAEWLPRCGVTTVAMEATGVYWIPVYEMLETRGVEVLLVNARHLKHVSARKSDVLDCEWLPDLQMVGLLRGSFRPPDHIVTLRGFLRHRDTLVTLVGTTVQRMQKALTQMNVRLALVVSDITGVTGLRILRDIVAGQRDAAALAAHRDRRCQASPDDVIAALTGHYRDEHVFALRQHLALFDCLQTHLAACDAAIHEYVQQLLADVAPPPAPLPPPRVAPRRARRLESAYDLRAPLYHLTGGVDLTQIDGLGAGSVLALLSEIGTDMTRWPTAKHFTSWLTLAPQNRVSGGRLLSSRTEPSANRAAAIFRMAAMTLGRTSTALGAYYRRLAPRLGKAQAITAVARKLAILVYRALQHELVYSDPGADAYVQQQRARRLRSIRDRAAALGYDLVNRQTGEVVSSPTSVPG
jgi:transposase